MGMTIRLPEGFVYFSAALRRRRFPVPLSHLGLQVLPDLHHHDGPEVLCTHLPVHVHEPPEETVLVYAGEGSGVEGEA